MPRLAVNREIPLQTTWGWKIAAYLFGAGMGAGAFALGAASTLTGALVGKSLAELAMWLGTIVVLGSALFLVWDLDRPERFLKVIFKVRRSWLARGAWILLGFGALAVLTLLAGAPAPMAWLSLLGAFTVAIYTGLLIGTMLSRPLWNTPILPVLFVISALSTGLALVIITGEILATGNAALAKEISAASAGLRTPHMLLLVSELLVLYFFLNIAYGRSRTQVELLVRGRLSTAFWGGVVGIGIVLPLVLEYLAGGAGALGVGLVLAAHVAVLLGGYMLRRLLLLAGSRSTVEMGGRFLIRPEV